MKKTTKQRMKEQHRLRIAAEWAADLVDALGITTPPIDPFWLAQSDSPQLQLVCHDFREAFDARIEYHPGKDLFLLFVNTKYDMGLAPRQHHPRTRFSLAHELGHFYLEPHRAYLMQSGEAHISEAEFANDTMVEREADTFAANLLMPKKLFRPLVNQGEISFDRVKEIAPLFGTSHISTAIRSVQNSDFPCAVIGVRDGQEAWRFQSPALIEGKCYPLPRGPLRSPTARREWHAFQAGNVVAGEQQGSPVNWFQMYGPSEKTFSVTEEYLGVLVMRTMLILLTIREQDLFDIADDSGS